MSHNYNHRSKGFMDADDLHKIINTISGQTHKEEHKAIKEELKEIKETLELIERFLGEDYAKLKEEESHLLEKDE